MVGTLKPDWLQAQIDQQQQARNNVFAENKAGKYINIDRSMLEELEQSSFRSRKSPLHVNRCSEKGIVGLHAEGRRGGGQEAEEADGVPADAAPLADRTQTPGEERRMGQWA